MKKWLVRVFRILALMKISAYYKRQGHQVEWWIPDKDYDLIYSSKVFNFTPENKSLPKETIKGGTGYNKFKNLSGEIDECYPDYSLYPQCDYAIGFVTRGCINNCDYCIVPKKEGNIKPYSRWQDIVRKNHDNKV